MVVVVLLFSAFLCLLLHLLLRRRPSHLPLPPGPYGFPFIGALPQIGPMPQEGLAVLSKRYGPIMYLKMGGHGTVIASSTAAARALLQADDDHFADRPSPATVINMTYGCQDIIFSRPSPRWKLLRNLCVTYMLGGRALHDLAPIRREEVGVLLRSLRDSSGTVVLVLDAFVSTVSNIIGRCLLSRRVFEDPEIRDMMLGLMHAEGFFGIGDLVPILEWLDPLGVQKFVRRKHQHYDAMISKMLAEHAASAKERESRPDFVDFVMQHRTGSDVGETVSEENIKGVILDMFTAGVEPPTVVMEWALAELVSNPEVMKRAQSEMDRVVGRDRRLEETDLPSLPYLQAVCKETFRRHPPAALGIPRCSTEPCEVEGYYIPANTHFFVNVWAMGRNPDMWEEPLEFRPDRFLMSDAGGRGAENDLKLMPFGIGRRMCVGKQTGLVLVQYIVGSLLHSFDWRLPDGEKEVDMGEKIKLSLCKAMPLKVLGSPRLASAAYM